MRITILTLFPEMFEGFLNTSIIKKARLKNIVEINVVDFRPFTEDKHTRVDEYPFGGGQGMVLMCQPILDALKSVRKPESHVILTNPAGEQYNQKIARELVKKDDIIILCGHYEGYDKRISEYVDQEISIGDFVLTGGELPAMVITDSITRLVKGVISEDSTEDESFENDLLEYPQYTRPVDYEGHLVPEVLLSGHHENIRKFRLYESLKLTYQRRRDLLEKHQFTEEERKMLEKIIEEEEKNA
ncbi:MAG: tRNA (guanosine(37)-N1)-methyltransferase TrmD [Erysipelotrichaceae bacterium]|nr:tRNA (guanosine(37)-N1)-methyltransferase TrmD [Erysipelotrichaceae bacterium]